jgi:hypothetical protein
MRFWEAVYNRNSNKNNFIGYFETLAEAKEICLAVINKEFPKDNIVLEWKDRTRGVEYFSTWKQENHVSEKTQSYASDRSGFSFTITEYELPYIAKSIIEHLSINKPTSAGTATPKKLGG